VRASTASRTVRGSGRSGSFGDEERVASGQHVHLVGVERRAVHQSADTVLGERREAERAQPLVVGHVAEQLARRVSRTYLVVAVGQQQRERQGANAPRDETEHVGGRCVDPVQVLDHEHGRLGREGGEHVVAHMGEQHVLVAEHGGEPGLRGEVAEGTQRTGRAQRIAPAPQESDPRTVGTGDLDQGRLAGAGVAGNRDARALAASRCRDRIGETCALVLALEQLHVSLGQRPGGVRLDAGPRPGDARSRPALSGGVRLDRVEVGALPQHRRLEIPQLRAGVQPQLLRQAETSGSGDGQGVGLAPRAVQRQHQLGREPFPEGVLVHQRLQPGDDRPVPAERELGVQPSLPGHEAQLVEVEDGRRREVRRAQVDQHLSPPQVECGAEDLVGRGRSVRGGALLTDAQQLVESAGVDGRRVGVEAVPAATALQRRRRRGPVEDLAHLSDVRPERRPGTGGGRLTPEVVDHPVDRQDLPAVEQERGQQLSWFLSTQRHRGPRSVPHLQRAEHSEGRRHVSQGRTPRALSAPDFPIGRGARAHGVLATHSGTARKSCDSWPSLRIVLRSHRLSRARTSPNRRPVPRQRPR
jgi:hypothetical protein